MRSGYSENSKIIPLAPESSSAQW